MEWFQSVTRSWPHRCHRLWPEHRWLLMRSIGDTRMDAVLKWCSEMDRDREEYMLSHIKSKLFFLLYESSDTIFYCKWNSPCINLSLVSGCDATHCNNANALHTLLLPCGVSVGGDNNEYMLMISWSRAATVPYEYHRIGARSGNVSLFLLSSDKAYSLYNQCQMKY